MPNQSKKNDKRFWLKWKQSGAVFLKEPVQTPMPLNPEELRLKRMKMAAELDYRMMWKALGNLTADEIHDLAQFEFHLATAQLPLSEQVRRYYLKVKSDKPDVAEKMKQETRFISGRTEDMGLVEEICVVLYRFLSGFVIYFEKNGFTCTRGRFIDIREY